MVKKYSYNYSNEDGSQVTYIGSIRIHKYTLSGTSPISLSKSKPDIDNFNIDLVKYDIEIRDCSLTKPQYIIKRYINIAEHELIEKIKNSELILDNYFSTKHKNNTLQEKNLLTLKDLGFN